MRSVPSGRAGEAWWNSMPRFQILSVEREMPVADFVADDSRDVLNVMHQKGCRHAHVYRDGDYLFSARLDDREVWSLYQRRSEPVPKAPAGVSGGLRIVKTSERC